MIRGARFEAAGQSDNFESWIQDGTFYQWTRDSDKKYNKLTITAGMFEQETGEYFSSVIDLNEVYSTIQIGNGKFSIRGTPSEDQTSGVPQIEIYSEDKIQDNPDRFFGDYDKVSRFRMTQDIFSNDDVPKSWLLQPVTVIYMMS
ncbi:hypothetical protein [Bacillus glycinifermentans]|uniref:Uncharacterized protein n=1 Tax=Bacillus glycinifermentans TaxID=1664069 RepID=A0A0T6BU10_9BACI|nr:hypothetical protein [Bacillus glycinifermentans]ATH92391.1 hypothetical protein COP00_06915 [Bacillus glycinifermentans]KRT95135.1 hypothetical protein AB447_211505 [Bacillus glycinifermentans]MEC0484922.1 hypothetical protein [Bacillus glycinifermentans]